ncbi:30S ribosomal protein S11 [Candidatus Microgenomates bacterium]|nr:30S ribosomal protein S11 [Candidatus Microgenomates bacterium]
MSKEKEEKIEDTAEETPIDVGETSDASKTAGDDTDKKAAKKKKKFKRHVPTGTAYVKATFNNTIISITDTQGNTVATSSAGSIGYSGSKKSTPYVAGLVANNVAAKAKTFGLGELNVFVKGIGSGRESAVRALQASGINITAIRDVTPLPHNGCRRKKARRV